MPKPIFLPKDNSIGLNISFLDIVHPSDDVSRGLPRYQPSHGVFTFLTHWLHQPISIRITFGRANKSIHHDIFGDSLVPVDSFVVEHEEVAIRPPAELGRRVYYLFFLIDGDLAHKVKLFVELYQWLVVCDEIEVLLGWRDRGCGDSVFVLGFYVHFPSLINSEYASFPADY